MDGPTINECNLAGWWTLPACFYEDCWDRETQAHMNLHNRKVEDLAMILVSLQTFYFHQNQDEQKKEEEMAVQEAVKVCQLPVESPYYSLIQSVLDQYTTPWL